MQFNPLNGYLYAAGDGGLYVSVNEGASWTNLSSGINVTQFYHIDDNDNNEYAFLGGTQDNGTMYRSTNTGSFTHVGGGDGFEAVIDYSNQNKGLAVANQSIYKYTDFANKTKQFIAKDSFYPQVELHTANPNRFYYSYDSLYTWHNGVYSLLGNGMINGYNALKTCPSNNDRIYAAGGYSFSNPTGKIYVTSDAGATWDTISNNPGYPIVNQRITDIGVNPSNSAKVFLVFAGYTADQKVYYSSNAGDTWTDYTYDLPNTPIWSIEVDANNNIYVGTDIGVFYKSNSLMSWEPFYNNLPNVPISDLAINESEDQLLAGTFGRGVWKCSLKSDCPGSITTSSDFEGRHFRAASNTITTTSTVKGGSGTEVVLRAGNSVVLNPGFEANGEPGNKFVAYTGNCDEGIPNMMGLVNTLFPSALSAYSKSLSRANGTIEVLANNSELTEVLVRVTSISKNNGEIFISEITSDKLIKLSEVSCLQNESNIVIERTKLKPGEYLLYLILENDITHIQELTINY